MGKFTTKNWDQFYPDAMEFLPPRMPEARGLGLEQNMFVDADHAGDRVTRLSQMGILVFLNRAPIIWYSKWQNTVESSTFGSEFIAIKTGVELVQGLRFKLHMMGIPVDGPANIFCDNEVVVRNSTIPESTLGKKHISICYHVVREAIAAAIGRVSKEPGETNLADILTKLVPGPRLRKM